MRRLRAAFAFLTIVPPGRSAEGLELAAGLPFFPVVGFLVGGIAGLVAELAGPHLGAFAGAALALLSQVLLTRNLHWDGLFDTIDGLLALPREQSLAAMRDPRIGGGAAVGGAIALVLFVALVAGMPPPHLPLALAAAGMAGRGAVAGAVALFPYARAEGLGKAFAGKSGTGLAVFIVTLAALAALLGLPGAIAAGLTLALVLLGGRYAVRRFGGCTGDVYGALEVLTEILVLACMVWR